ncbi:MAG: DUF2911 domain-containing protein [Cytophagales bacterium]|nr:MAG: DUF2911 domain-containing protein [Cytophagales bacterium]
MKKIIIIIASIVAVIAAAGYGFRTFTKMASPETSSSFDKNGLKVSVSYSQPSKKGREIFGKLVPYGAIWRTGANEATEIEISKDVTVAGQALKAGKYSLFTIPNQDKWTVVFNSEIAMWGLSYDEKNDVLRVDVPTTSRDEMLEKFTISLQEAEGGADMMLEWDKTKVVVPIR